jgi:hypothetical protein
MNETTLFEVKMVEHTLRAVAVPAGGPRGDRLRIEVDGNSIDLIEGHARQLHLAMRAWVRKQKELRGDTPRGQRKFLQRQLQYAQAKTASATSAPGSAQ